MSYEFLVAENNLRAINVEINDLYIDAVVHGSNPPSGRRVQDIRDITGCSEQESKATVGRCGEGCAVFRHLMDNSGTIFMNLAKS